MKKLILICAVMLAGCDDHQQAQAEHEHYLEMVCGGYWPDYKGVGPECAG